MNRLIILIGILAMVGACAANQTYIVPEECPENALQLPAGTDKVAQGLILFVSVKYPEAKKDIELGLIALRGALEDENITTTMFRILIGELLQEVDTTYGEVIAILAPEARILLTTPIFLGDQILDFCKKHRLIFFINETLDNLSIL